MLRVCLPHLQSIREDERIGIMKQYIQAHLATPKPFVEQQALARIRYGWLADVG